MSVPLLRRVVGAWQDIGLSIAGAERPRLFSYRYAFVSRVLHTSSVTCTEVVSLGVDVSEYRKLDLFFLDEKRGLVGPPMRPSRTRTATRTILAITLVAHAARADPMPAPAMLPTPEPHIRFEGGNGSSCRQAVVIAGASHETEGVRAQRWWVFTKQAGSRIVSQELSEEDGRQLDTIRILTPDGSSKTICFDITSFFGKP